MPVSGKITTDHASEADKLFAIFVNSVSDFLNRKPK